MKREGRQHGMVRSYKILPSLWNPRPDQSKRCINKFDTPTTAALFTKVQPKPTNHSKFTGKCGKPRCTECHIHPCCKSKDKTKGGQRLRSYDVVSNHRLMTWRVVDGRNNGRNNLNGLSATGMLRHLASETRDEHESYDYYDDEDEDGDEEFDVGVQEFVVGVQEFVDDDNSGFCDVGFVLDQVEGEEEGWCLVAEL